MAGGHGDDVQVLREPGLRRRLLPLREALRLPASDGAELRAAGAAQERDRTASEAERLRNGITATAAEVFPCRSTVHSAEDNLVALRGAFRELRGEGHRLRAELRRTTEELERTKSELHRPRGDGLSVDEHIALVQRAQGISKTDHAETKRQERGSNERQFPGAALHVTQGV